MRHVGIILNADRSKCSRQWSWFTLRYYPWFSSKVLEQNWWKGDHASCTYQPMLCVNVMGYKDSVTSFFFYQLHYLLYSLSIWWHVSCRVYLVKWTFISKQIKLTVTPQCSKFQQLIILIQCSWTEGKKSQCVPACACMYLHLCEHIPSWCTEFCCSGD